MCAEMNYMVIPGIPSNTNRKRSKLLTKFVKGIIINTVCEHFNFLIGQLQAKSKKREVVFPRQLIMYFLSEYTNETYLHIGQFFNRDHSTAIHAKNLIKDLMKVDTIVRDEVEAIKQKIINNHV